MSLAALVATAQFSLPIGLITAADISSAIALVVQRPESVAMIQHYRGSISFSTNPDIVRRREDGETTYCPHQVIVFASSEGPDVFTQVSAIGPLGLEHASIANDPRQTK